MQSLENTSPRTEGRVAEIHDDGDTIRRGVTIRRPMADVLAEVTALVDDGFLARESGEYWRAGGSTPLSRATCSVSSACR